ncbi:uncharacterized protein LOC141854784 [Brevipalpus obovatus]|uniref:uncharacterized protein LOC141854784 n=1 Tax=Brevipalpus obovatus TaxID=246614 RepID=UPI003D9E4E2A
MSSTSSASSSSSLISSKSQLSCTLPNPMNANTISTRSENQLKCSMNAMKETVLRNKITKDYGALSDEICRLKRENEELKFENKELKEEVDYLNNEKQIFEEDKKDVTDIENKLREVSDKMKDLEISKEALVKELKDTKEQLNQCSDKYTLHKASWEENLKRAEEDIVRLDALVDEIVLAFNANRDVIAQSPLLAQIHDRLLRSIAQSAP